MPMNSFQTNDSTMTSILSQKNKLRDYQELLEFAQEELKADNIRLAQLRQQGGSKKEIEELEGEIKVLEQAVDRYQDKVINMKKLLRENESEDI